MRPLSHCCDQSSAKEIQLAEAVINDFSTMVRRSNPLIKIVDFSFANLAIFSSSGCPVGGSGRLAESGCGVLIPSLCVTSALSLSQYCSVTVSTVLLCGVLRSVVRY